MCQSNLKNEICNDSVSDAIHLDATKWRNTLKFSHNFADDLWSTCSSCISLKYFTVDFIVTSPGKYGTRPYVHHY